MPTIEISQDTRELPKTLGPYQRLPVHFLLYSRGHFGIRVKDVVFDLSHA